MRSDRCLDTAGDCGRSLNRLADESWSSDPFDAQRAYEAIARVSLVGCRTFEAIAGKGSAEVVFRPSGKVGQVRVDDPFDHTFTGGCIEHELSKVRVPPFAGGNQTVKRSFSFD